ncbi:serine-rich adhesin for platelets-like [Gossypium australe]|uniref:Serine-rich adhesin for platelets-like n=1 Tax=Gossypium australe TaxID=47621 RepID=A0A5B6UDF9_9ROSI|nr:serine-rich adhesin for platelets-like [Gossypium australe]
MAIEDAFEMKILAGNLFTIDDDGGDDSYGSSLENGSKLKPQTPVNFNRKLNNTLCNRGSNAISILGERPSLKCMSAKKKSKVVQASKLIVECEKPSSSVRGILKNPGNGRSGQNSARCNLRATTQASTCGIQHSVKHVSFSGKDDILGPHEKHVATLEKNICHADLDSFELSEKGHQNDTDKGFPAREINTSDDEDVSFSTGNGIAVQAMKGKQLLPDIHYNVDIPKFLGPCILSQEKANQFSDRSLPPGQVVIDSGNLHMSNQGNQTTFCSPPFTVAPRLFSAVKEIQNPFVNSEVCGGVSTTLNSSSQFVDYFGDHNPEVAISSKANPRVSLHPSSSDFALSKNVSETAPFTSQFASGNVSGHALSHQPLYCLAPNELRGRLCPFLDCKQKNVAIREKCRDEDFFGLPLNSLGELVQTNSNAKGGFDQLKKPGPGPASSNNVNNLVFPRSTDDHSIMKGKHYIGSALPNNQLSLFPAQNHTKENATLHSSARLGASELHGHRKYGYCTKPDRRCNCSDCLMDSDINLINISFTGCGQYDQFWNRKEKDISHAMENAEKMLLNSPTPTMRLMGKDVTICQSSNERQGLADAPKSIGLQNSCVDKHFQQEWLLDPAPGKCKETSVRQFEIARNQAFPRNVPIKPHESNFFQPGINWQANPEFQNSSSITIARDPNPSSCHFAHPHTSHAIFDNGGDFQEPFISRTETLRVSSLLPAVSASHRNSQNINGNSVELESNSNLLNAGKSSFNFPFLHPDNVEHVQPSWCRDSSKSLIPWLLQARQQVQAPSTPSQLFPDVGGICHPHTARTSFLINRMVPHFPIVSYDHNPMIPLSHMESSVGQPSLAHSPLIPSLPVIKPTSVTLSQRNGIKFKDRMKAKFVSTQDPDICQNSRKRPAVKEDYLMKPIKLPNLGIRDDSRAETQLTRENFNDIQCNMGTLELEPERNEESVGGWILNESQYDGFGLSAGIDSSKVDAYGVTRLGPIKLSPGVKHILKPNQKVDQDNSRLIHSTIPFASVTECGKMLETLTKSTNIYRF